MTLPTPGLRLARLAEAVTAAGRADLARGIRRAARQPDRFEPPFRVRDLRGAELRVRRALPGEGRPGELVAEYVDAEGLTRLLATEAGPVLLPATADEAMERRSFRCSDELWAWLESQGKPGEVARQILERAKEAAQRGGS